MKNLNKRVGLLCGLSLCAMITFAGTNLTVCANTIDTVETEEAGRSTILQWAYKQIDGVWHRRLYNHSTGEWLTEWTPVPPGTEIPGVGIV